MTLLDPLYVERFWLSTAVDGDLDILFHPDIPNQPGTGAVESITVGENDWHRLADFKPVILGDYDWEIPFIIDLTYQHLYGPYWLYTAINICCAAFMMGLLKEERIMGAVRFISNNPDLQGVIAGANRLGVPPIEIFMIVHGMIEE
jgi:hypothetical protein